MLRLLRLLRLFGLFGLLRLFRLFRLLRLLRLGRLIRVDLRHQRPRRFLVHRRHLVCDDVELGLCPVIRSEIPQHVRVIRRVTRDRQHVGGVRGVRHVPRVGAVEPRRAFARRDHIRRDFRLARLLALFRLFRLLGLFRLLRLLGLLRLLRLLRLGRLIRVDLRHQRPRRFLVHRRHLVCDDVELGLCPVIRSEIPQHVRVIRRVTRDRQHVGGVRGVRHVPRVGAVEPRRAFARRDHIRRDFRLARLFGLLRLLRLFRLLRLLGLFRLFRLFGLLRLLRLFRLLRLLRLFRLFRLLGLFRLLRLFRLLGLLRLFRLFRLFRLLRLFRLSRRRRFKAILPERVVGLLAIHRRGRLRGQHGQHAAGDHVVHDIQPLVNRARKAALQKRHFGV